MESSRSQGKVVYLLPCQTRDPGRGSFMVHPMGVQKGGHPKRVPNPDYTPGDPYAEPTLPVFRSSHHVFERGRHGLHVEPHDMAFDFAVRTV